MVGAVVADEHVVALAAEDVLDAGDARALAVLAEGEVDQHAGLAVLVADGVGARTADDVVG